MLALLTKIPSLIFLLAKAIKALPDILVIVQQLFALFDKLKGNPKFDENTFRKEVRKGLTDVVENKDTQTLKKLHDDYIADYCANGVCKP